MASTISEPGPEVMTPTLDIPDPSTRWWVGQVVLRLRREVGWHRQIGTEDPGQGALDLLRHRAVKEQFFAGNIAARYLSQQIEEVEPHEGLFARLSALTGLTTAERFVLALALAARIDGALGPVFALCYNDTTHPWPTLELAQALWDDPLAVLSAGDPVRPLRRMGLIQARAMGEMLSACPVLARYLAGEDGDFGLTPVDAGEGDVPAALVNRLMTPPSRLEVIGLVGPARADATGFLAALQAADVRPCLAATSIDRARIIQAWLAGADLSLTTPLSERETASTLALIREAQMRVFLHVTHRDVVMGIPQDLLGPILNIPKPSHTSRAIRFKAALGTSVKGLPEVARDFRLEPEEIARIAAAILEPTRDKLMAACRIECSVDFQGLAESIEPRFGQADIVLPPAVDRQFSEALAAIKGSARLHHDWDGGKLGDGGIPLLFAGSPGTGKTMAAEVIAHELDLPLFRIDLSQVVNKYIGETEKNLKRVFDAAERMRCILFFDEAEALFGKRTEVKDANDRFANIETGYLLQRMDSFSGVSVLATNRRRDLDDAFARRLRYVIEFPVPGVPERQRIWEHVFPDAIDISDLDVGFLARQFQITGGHIRSIALNASLQAAARSAHPKVAMRDVLIATKRELDKLNRKSGVDAFGPYFSEIEELRV